MVETYILRTIYIGFAVLISSVCASASNTAVIDQSDCDLAALGSAADDLRVPAKNTPESVNAFAREYTVCVAKDQSQQVRLWAELERAGVRRLEILYRQKGDVQDEVNAKPQIQYVLKSVEKFETEKLDWNDVTTTSAMEARIHVYVCEIVFMDLKSWDSCPFGQTSFEQQAEFSYPRDRNLMIKQFLDLSDLGMK